MDIERANPILTAKIVGSYLRQHRVRSEELPQIITSVGQTLGQLGQPVQPEEIRTPAVSVRRSVSQEYVICLDWLPREDAATAHQQPAWFEPR
jgi:predicted transcriptional regulator